MKILVTVLAFAAALASATPASAAGGSFVSSDPLLNRIWRASVKTATDMLASGPLRNDVQGRPCAIDLEVVILDGLTRDRCPYIGDGAVVGKTLLLAGGTSAPALRDTILWFAVHQHADGAIPASPFEGGTYVLFDYNAYWVETLYDYVLSTGDVAVATRRASASTRSSPTSRWWRATPPVSTPRRSS